MGSANNNMENDSYSQQSLEEIQSYFRNSDNLSFSRINALRQDVLKKNSIVNQQLHSQVESQIESMIFAYELMEKSTENINIIRNNFNEIDKLCQDAQKEIQEFEKIKEINRARDNINHTLTLLKLLEQIPQKTDMISEKIHDDNFLLIIYKELKKLIASYNSCFSSNFHENEIERDEFAKLLQLVTELEQKIWIHINNSLSLSKNDPQTLVKIICIVEMEDHDPHVKVFPPSTLRFRQRVFNELEKGMIEKFSQLYNMSPPISDPSQTQSQNYPLSKTNFNLISSTSNGTVILDSIIERINKLLTELQDVQQYLVPCFPPDYDLFSFFDHRYIHWLNSRLLDIFSSSLIESANPGQLFHYIDWLYHFKKLVNSFSSINVSSIVNNINDNLVQHYIAQGTPTLWKCLQNILINEEKDIHLSVDENGYYYTDLPVDLMFTINNQYHILSCHLFGNHFVSGLHMICDLLLNFISNYQLSSKNLKEESMILAVLNNFHHLNEEVNKLCDISQEHLKHEDPQLSEETEHIFDDVCQEILHHSQTILSLLISLFLSLLFNSCFMNPFSNDWFNLDVPSFVKDVINIMEDYFNLQKKNLINEAIHYRLVEDCFVKILEKYSLCFLEQKIQINHTVLKISLERDLELFKKYHHHLLTDYPHLQLPRSQHQLNILEQYHCFLTLEADFISTIFGDFHHLLGKNSMMVIKKLLEFREDIDKKQKTLIIQGL